MNSNSLLFAFGAGGRDAELLGEARHEPTGDLDILAGGRHRGRAKSGSRRGERGGCALVWRPREWRAEDDARRFGRRRDVGGGEKRRSREAHRRLQGFKK